MPSAKCEAITNHVLQVRHMHALEQKYDSESIIEALRCIIYQY